MTQVVLPKLSQTGKNEWADVEDNDVALREVVNSELANDNIEAGAGIVDTKLASPNNSTYKTLLSSQQSLRTDLVAGTYILARAAGEAPLSGASLGATPVPFVYFDDADYDVAGLTQKLRIFAAVAANATQPTITFTFGLYPISFGGGADALTMTLGTVVTGSTAAIASPPASNYTGKAGSDFAVPADGAYALGVVTSGTLTNNSACLLSAHLQTRNV